MRGKVIQQKVQNICKPGYEIPDKNPFENPWLTQQKILIIKAEKQKEKSQYSFNNISLKENIMSYVWILLKTSKELFELKTVHVITQLHSYIFHVPFTMCTRNMFK